MTYADLMYFYRSMGMSQAEAHCAIMTTLEMRMAISRRDSGKKTPRGIKGVWVLLKSTLDVSRIWQVCWPKPAPLEAIA